MPSGAVRHASSGSLAPLGAYIEAQLKPPELRTAEECDQRPEVVLREIGANLANIRELAAPVVI